MSGKGMKEGRVSFVFFAWILVFSSSHTPFHPPWHLAFSLGYDHMLKLSSKWATSQAHAHLSCVGVEWLNLIHLSLTWVWLNYFEFISLIGIWWWL